MICERVNKLKKVLSNRYELIREIGQGGAGNVYLAYDRHLCHEVAIKKCGDLLHEVDVLKQMEHSALPKVYDFFREDGFDYMAMEYVRGTNLADLIRESGPLKEQQVILLMDKLISVIDYLHSFNPPIIYCDLKPENIMIRGDGHVKLVDFGAAFMLYGTARNPVRMGTPGFTAPELFDSGCEYQENCDVYSLGAVFYFVLSGKVPGMKKIERDWELRKVASSGIRKIITRCMIINPEKRYQNIGRLADDLMNYKELEFAMMVKHFVRRLLLFCAHISVLVTGALVILCESLNVDMPVLVSDNGLWSFNREFPVTVVFLAGVLLMVAGLFFLLAVSSRRGIKVKIVKSVCLSDKKTVGLWVMVVFCMIMSVFRFDDVYAGGDCEMLCKPKYISLLPTFIRDMDGYKLLIMHGVVYRPTKDIIIEIPLAGLPQGEEVVLKVVVEGVEGVYESREYLVGVD